MNIEVLSALLRQRNLGSNYATNGKNALSTLEERLKQVIFLDYSMPDMNGPEVAKEMLMLL